MPGLAEVEVQGCVEGCDHVWGDVIPGNPRGGSGPNAKETHVEGGQTTYARQATRGQYCLRCGGWRGSLGLEKTLTEYIAHLVLVFRSVWRVLRDDGCCFVNIGDSYAAAGYSRQENTGGAKREDGGKQKHTRVPSGLKPKDLIGIPWRLAFALQADGWWNRSEIIWAKGVSFCKTYSGSSMPESVRDRPSRSFEHLFLLSKSKTYYYDHIAVKESASSNTHSRGPEYHKLNKTVAPGQGIRDNESFSEATWGPVSRRNLRSVWLHSDPAAEFRAYCTSQGVDLDALAQGFVDGNRELRDTWVINPAASKLKHYASYPPALVEPCIKAGTSARGCCPECGAPWERVVEKKLSDSPASYKGSTFTNGKTAVHQMDRAGQGARTDVVTTIGWIPTCICYDDRYRTDFPRAKNARKRRQRQASGDWWRRVRKRPGRDHWEVEPCTILDIFAGTGVTLKTAMKLGRHGIGIDLSRDYCEIMVDELSKSLQIGLF